MIEDAPFTVTLKAGTGYNDPWVVVRASSAVELQARLNELEDHRVFLTVTRVSNNLQATAHPRGEKEEKWTRN